MRTRFHRGGVLSHIKAPSLIRVNPTGGSSDERRRKYHLNSASKSPPETPPQPCHPACPGVPWERSRGTCCAPFPLTTPYISAHPSPPMPRWTMALNLVIPPAPACRGSVAEGPAVRPSLSQLPTALSIHLHQCPGGPWPSTLSSRLPRRAVGAQPRDLLCALPSHNSLQLCPSTSTNAQVDHGPQPCHPERSRGTCGSTPPAPAFASKTKEPID